LSETPPISELKRLLRERALSARARLAPAERAERSRAIAERVAGLEAFRRARTVALYAPLGAEVDTAEIARRALASGKTLVWPRLAAGERRLEFAACPAEELVKGPVGARQPPPAAGAVPAESIDLFVVPGVAFDAAGARLGRGGGHYDAALGAAPRRSGRIGLAFEAQLVAEVPREPHDALLDAVVTEDQVLRAAGAPG
jgi:5-formyltetrahydrofolate cyclo-ligase